jgi:hypothetical protein
MQPINAELAVEVSYPSDENAVEATQQLCGNLFSALLVPLCVTAAKSDFQLLKGLDIRCFLFYFCFFGPWIYVFFSVAVQAALDHWKFFQGHSRNPAHM